MNFFEPYFLPVVLVAAVTSALLRARYRWILLICTSLALYAIQGFRDFAILAGMLLLNIGAVASGATRRRWGTGVIVATDLAVLFSFKYVSWLVHGVAGVHGSLGILDLALPLGISFYTFQLIAYVVDSYRARSPLLRPQHAAAFVTFFPQLVAGPILRAVRDGSQFVTPTPRPAEIPPGVLRIVWGMFKKRVLADSIAPIVGAAFSDPGTLTAPGAVAAVLGFTLQLYLDFSAYADMAIGLGQLFGIHLPENFDRPYLATSLRDFWRRWHITLSTWLRDYLYIPLGGSRTSWPRASLNLLVTMALGGLWHGANWTFLIWGLWHGSGVLVERLLRKYVRLDLPACIRGCMVFLFVAVGWVFFRADNLNIAGLLLRQILDVHSIQPAEWIKLGSMVGVLAMLLFTEAMRFKSRALVFHPLIQGLIAGALVALTYFASANETEFIYWRF